jgi:ATP-dependent RNA helicase RhlE
VINFDMPRTVDAYTHRIGRTGRSEREGRGYTFVTSDDEALVRAVERRMGARIPRRSVDGIAKIRPADDRSGTAHSTRTTDRRRVADNDRRPSRARRRKFRSAS